MRALDYWQSSRYQLHTFICSLQFRYIVLTPDKVQDPFYEAELAAKRE